MKAPWTPVAAILLSLLLIPVLGVAEDDSDSDKKGVWSTLDLQLYGMIKLDAAYDTGHANPGNFVKWVDLDLENPDDAAFSMTANQTRLGLWVQGPEDDSEANLVTRGNVEIDFYGGGAENKPRPMMRQAFVELDWRRSGWKLLAGQTSDLISPLVPTTINYSVAWWAGNIGYRRPQIRGTRRVKLGETSRLEIAAAITRNIGDAFSDLENRDAGTDSELPGVQLGLGLGLGGSGAGSATVGVSGHWAEEEFHLNEAGDTEIFSSWSLNVDYRHQLAERVRFQLEAFTGADLAPYLGGIAQGINLEAMNEVRSAGGWAALDFGPYHQWMWHLGGSLDDPDDDDLEIGDRSRNSAVWGSGVVSLNSHVKLGLELSYWSTEYKDQGKADDFRTQFAVYYLF